ncbi:50S ribosomal protein L20 [Planctomycetales bacterium]|nr:50S ribosomal protein L20 [Planctomycetales bacterium]
MSRSTYGVARHHKKKRLFKRAKGMIGGRSKLYRVAKHSVLKAERFATRDRRARKGEFRRLWITRISAALLDHNLNYSRFIDGLKKAGITLDRKVLSELAISNPAEFGQVVEQAKAALK